MPTDKLVERWSGILLLVALALICCQFQACTRLQSSPQSALFPAGIEGLWSGTSVASCEKLMTEFGRCNAQQKITFNIVRNDSKYVGTYSCAYGNMVCRNGNDLGKIVGVTMTGSDLTRLRVELPDGSSCLFSGTFQKEKVIGTYQCYGGASIIEQGSWQASRQF
jgi:hypothetical protein